MTFTLNCIISSLATVLTAQYPDYPVYASPNQQGTKWPCFFIFFMPSSIEDEIGGRYLRGLGIDIIFVQQRNPLNGNMQLQEIADFLDATIELFSYTDENGKTAILRTCERQWKTEDGELHYQFHIRQRVSLPRTENPMKEMEENNASIKEK